MLPLLFAGKKSRGAVFQGGVLFFEKMGHGIVHFARGAWFRYFGIFAYFETRDGFGVFAENLAKFSVPIGFCRHFPAKCYLWG